MGRLSVLPADTKIRLNFFPLENTLAYLSPPTAKNKDSFMILPLSRKFESEMEQNSIEAGLIKTRFILTELWIRTLELRFLS